AQLQGFHLAVAEYYRRDVNSMPSFSKYIRTCSVHFKRGVTKRASRACATKSGRRQFKKLMTSLLHIKDLDEFKRVEQRIKADYPTMKSYINWYCRSSKGKPARGAYLFPALRDPSFDVSHIADNTNAQENLGRHYRTAMGSRTLPLFPALEQTYRYIQQHEREVEGEMTGHHSRDGMRLTVDNAHVSKPRKAKLSLPSYQNDGDPPVSASDDSSDDEASYYEDEDHGGAQDDGDGDGWFLSMSDTSEDDWKDGSYAATLEDMDGVSTTSTITDGAITNRQKSSQLAKHHFVEQPDILAEDVDNRVDHHSKTETKGGVTHAKRPSDARAMDNGFRSTNSDSDTTNKHRRKQSKQPAARRRRGKHPVSDPTEFFNMTPSASTSDAQTSHFPPFGTSARSPSSDPSPRSPSAKPCPRSPSAGSSARSPSPESSARSPSPESSSRSLSPAPSWPSSRVSSSRSLSPASSLRSLEDLQGSGEDEPEIEPQQSIPTRKTRMRTDGSQTGPVASMMDERRKTTPQRIPKALGNFAVPWCFLYKATNPMDPSIDFNFDVEVSNTCSVDTTLVCCFIHRVLSAWSPPVSFTRSWKGQIFEEVMSYLDQGLPGALRSRGAKVYHQKARWTWVRKALQLKPDMTTMPVSLDVWGSSYERFFDFVTPITKIKWSSSRLCTNGNCTRSLQSFSTRKSIQAKSAVNLVWPRGKQGTSTVDEIVVFASFWNPDDCHADMPKRFTGFRFQEKCAAGFNLMPERSILLDEDTLDENPDLPSKWRCNGDLEATSLKV
ncbi:hypothetical protein DFQ26_001007, partial [Actinomortierella ambigua]